MWYGMLVVWYDGTVSWIYYMAKLVVWYVSVYKVREGRIRRTNIICNDLIYQPLDGKCPCGQTDRQTGRQTDSQIPQLTLSSN